MARNASGKNTAGKNNAADKNKVAILGSGKLGTILLQALLRDGSLNAASTWTTVAHPDRARALKDKFKVHAGTDNREAVRGGCEYPFHPLLPVGQRSSVCPGDRDRDSGDRAAFWLKFNIRDALTEVCNLPKSQV